jgi:predicted transposase YdaD
MKKEGEGKGRGREEGRRKERRKSNLGFVNEGEKPVSI